MSEYTIVTSWGESTSFACTESNLAAMVEEAAYVAWEMTPAARLRTDELAHRLATGIPTVFTYHGLEPAELVQAGNFLFLTEI